MAPSPHISRQRTAETLLLDGFRCWARGIAENRHGPWAEAWNLYAKELGPSEGRAALDALSRFVGRLSNQARTTFGAHPAGCPLRSSHEILLLGLVGAFQLGDEAAVPLCLDGLGCPTPCPAVEAAAAELALLFKAFGLALEPVSPHLTRTLFTQGAAFGSLH